LNGYRSARTLSPADEAAVPLFVAARELWILGLHARTAPDRGHGWNVLDEGYLDRRLGFLRRSAAKLSPP